MMPLNGSPPGKKRKVEEGKLSDVAKEMKELFPYCHLTDSVLLRFHYKNITLDEPPRHIYTYNGEVSFETDEGSTAFHGVFATYIDPAYTMQFTFHWRGDRRHMKTTVVECVQFDTDGRRMFAGQDSSGRRIDMMENGSAVWCNTCECWHWHHSRAHPDPLHCENTWPLSHAGVPFFRDSL